ncbi:S8 family serine peptidase [Deinococcus sp. YIM 134068]|uniref:S8 family peptidase n=1 Tax=Deinococcus lichenicola TaxID=3118910 RepID=UPI002F94AB15
MREKFVVLRETSVPDATRDVFGGLDRSPWEGRGPLAGGFRDLSFPSRPSLPRVTVETLDRRDLPALTSEPGVRAVAPSIPLRLIEPVSREAAPSATGPTWGVRAVGADTSPFTGQGAVVAVLDTGIDATHPAFAGVDLVQRDFTGEGDGDSNGHGTHCAGTVFGRDVEGQRIGVARGVTRALIGKVLGQQGGSSEGIASAMIWAVENGAHVISMSLGIDFPGLVRRLTDGGYPTELATSLALEGYRANVRMFEALAVTAQYFGGAPRPVLLVAAAGNESRRAENPDWEISVAPPAVSTGFLSVAALGEPPAGGSGLRVAPFSNTNANVAAPGVNVTSAQAGGGLVAYSGTSMATPHVAGVAALWVEKLTKEGQLSLLTLSVRVPGSASRTALTQGTDPADVGLGLVRAPEG